MAIAMVIRTWLFPLPHVKRNEALEFSFYEELKIFKNDFSIFTGRDVLPNINSIIYNSPKMLLKTASKETLY